MLPMLAASLAAGAVGGFANSKKDSGRDAGNGLALSAEDDALAKRQLAGLLNYQDNPDVVDPIKGSRTATSEVQGNSILGQLFGNEGTMSRTAKEEQDLASRGFSLKPEDHEAYGQASDQIAREFGMQENGLAQALANRGLSSSAGAVGQSFAGLQGNKMERLAQSQRKIADDRMKMNMERLGQTRNFLGQLGQQGQSAIQGQYNRQMDGANTQFGRLMDKNSAAQSRLMAQQGQANEQLGQRAATEAQPGWASALGGMAQAGQQMGMAQATGGLSGAKKPPTGGA